MRQEFILFFGFLVAVPLSVSQAQVPTVINVEIDWMEIPGVGGHSHRPQQAEIDAAIQMFACHDITLNVVISNAIGHTNIINFTGGGSNNFPAIKRANFNSGNDWHYCLFAHQHSQNPQSSGIADDDDDFMVTLGAWPNQIGSSWDSAATFVHELGHNLGLEHSGNMDEDTSGPFVPNLPSVMSYFYQLTGVRYNLERQGLAIKDLNLFKNLDYSNGIACALNEDELNENIGMGFNTVDWDCNGKIEGIVAHDLSNNSTHNGWCNADGARSILTDYNEWANIRDNTAASSIASKSSEPLTHKVFSCITYPEYQRHVAQISDFHQPNPVVEPCVGGRMVYLDANFPLGGFGFCNFPYNTLTTAASSVPDSSILYLRPGIYLERGPMLKIEKKMIITSIGASVIQINQ